MRGSLYINVLAPEAVTIDMSESPSRLINERTSYGHAFLQTLGRLGVGFDTLQNGTAFPTLRLEGTVDTIRNNAHRLKLLGGSIACAAAQAEITYGSDRREVSDTIRELATKTIPDLPQDIDLAYAAAELAYPFALLTNDDGIYVAFNFAAPWLVEAARQNAPVMQPEQLVMNFPT